MGIIQEENSVHLKKSQDKEMTSTLTCCTATVEHATLNAIEKTQDITETQVILVSHEAIFL